MKTNKEKSSTRFLFPALLIGMAATKLASGGGGYEQICVPVSKNSVQCVATNKVEKFLSGMGLQTLAQQGGGSDALLVCDDGLLFSIDTEDAERFEFPGMEDGAGVFETDIPFPCTPPAMPPELPSKAKRYGPKGEAGGSLCSGRTDPNNCKDCCLSVSLAQAGMVAAGGKFYRDTKPGPKGLAADAVVELAAYGLIYWSRHTCDDNCEISYEMTERKLR